MFWIILVNMLNDLLDLNGGHDLDKEVYTICPI